MNIKELMEWRYDCFFCHKALIMQPIIFERDVDSETWVKPFSIKDDILIIENESMTLSIHIKTGELVDLNQEKIMVKDYLKSKRLYFDFKCLSCTSRPQLYHYQGKISITHKKYIDIPAIYEYVYINNYFLSQVVSQEVINCNIRVYDNNENYIPNSDITISFLDLKKIAPEKLEQKIKTFIVFS
jgi:hypothetical protein